MKCRVEKAEKWDDFISNQPVATYYFFKARFESYEKIWHQGIVDCILYEEKKVVSGLSPKTYFYTFDASISRFMHGKE
jgi:hypothetical protein